MTHIIQIDKRRAYIAGLFWQPLSADARKETPSLFRGAGPATTQLAEDMKFDLAVFRIADTLQVGLATTEDGAQAGMCSIAAVITKTIEVEYGQKDFLCATETPDGKWLYIAQRGGVLLPDGDFIGSEDQVRSRILGDLSLGTWELVYAPGHWGIQDSTERSFDDFLPKKRNGDIDYKQWWALAPIKKSIAKPVVALGVAAAVLMGGLWYYGQWQEKQRQEEIYRQALLAAQMAGQEVAEQTPPWHEMPRAVDMWNACFGAMNSVKTLWPGNWSPVSATCVNDAFTVAWQREAYGWIEHLKQVIPGIVLSLDGEMASFTVPYTPSGPDVTGDPAPAERERVLAMHTVAQKYDFVVGLQSAPAQPVLPGQNIESAPVRWKVLQWQVRDSALSPSVVLAALDGDGFRVSSIQVAFDGGSMNWSLEGVQYVQP